MLQHYLEPLDSFMWGEEDVVAEKDVQMSHTRFAVVHRKPYKGANRTVRYQKSNWWAGIERDLDHDQEDYLENHQDHGLQRARHNKRWLPHTLALIINEIYETAMTRET